MFERKKIPYNWTIYAPSNKAFENTPKQLEKLILKDIDYSKRLFDHILTKEILASDFTEKITTEVTVISNQLNYIEVKIYLLKM